MKKITIYTTTYCGYCRAAKHLLEEQEAPFTEIDVTDDDKKRQWLVEATRQRTVPQIFVGEEAIGGYSDLQELVRKGTFRTMIENGY